MDFIEALGPQRQRDMFYRGHPVDFGWRISEQIAARFPQVVIDDHKHPFGYQMNRARLVVFDQPGTTLLEALAANVPTIMFFDPRHWDFRPEAQPYFDMLQRAGIFHDTPPAAAQQVAQVYERVDPWWFSPDVQEARTEFVKHFALGSADWNRQWVEAIAQELQKIKARSTRGSL